MNYSPFESAVLFSSSVGMLLLAFSCCYLCVNGFVSKVLDRQLDRVARFAFGFFMVVSGILIAQTNILAGMTWMQKESVLFKMLARFWIMGGLALCVQSMLDMAGKKYWAWGLSAIIACIVVSFSIYWWMYS